MATALRYEFGKNWSDFLDRYSNERLIAAQKSLIDFLGHSDLTGKRFVDIGCGSGIFSLAAYTLGAKRVLSFDLDGFSCACTRKLHGSINSPENWQVLEGSALDREFLARLGTFDIVFSWGVLHHTGSMWEAIRNAAQLVAPGGRFYIALYNRVPGKSEKWAKRKRFYCQASKPVKLAIEAYYILKQRILRHLVHGRNPFKIAFRDFGKERGMHWLTDLRDWLGGYPYECCTVEELFVFMRREYPGFVLENIKTESSESGNNWFLFHNR